MPTLFDKALKKYEDSDIVVQMKARFFFFLCLATIILFPVVLFYTAYLQLRNPLLGYRIDFALMAPELIIFLIFIAILLLIIRGYFIVAVHIMMILSFAVIWIIIILDRSFIVSRLDTIAFLFAILSLAPLAAISKGRPILIYGGINLAILVAFIIFFGEQFNIPRNSSLDYLADNSISLVLITIISFSIFAINRKAMERANKEITERIRVEEARHESEERYRTLFEYSRDAIMIIEPPSWKFTAANPTFMNMLRFGDRIEDYRNLAPWDLSPEIQPDGEPSYSKGRNMIDKAMTEGWCFFEWQHRRLDGQVFPSTVLLSKCQLKNRTFLQATVRDITERKRAEEQTRASLEEKEVLLKEIHHRVKNNFQIIISLLNLQSGSIKDHELLKIFNDTSNRIRAMALVHEKLYLSEDIAKIDFTSYIRTISEDLHNTYSIGTSRPRMHIETDDIHLGIDQAIPCGLIVNELITNALKYAFPDGSEPGVIRVSLRRSGTDKIILGVSDTGVGIPGEVDVENTSSLGLQLVNVLIKQIHGTYSFSRAGGTSWTITFPISVSL
jgi:PAS domain S-box-containing protein